MKKIKLMFRKIIVIIVLIEIILSCFGAGIASSYTKEEVAGAVAGYAQHVVDTYGPSGKNTVKYDQSMNDQNPFWRPDKYTWDSPTIYFDCKSFANGCFNYVAGFSLPNLVTSKMVNFPSPYPEYFDEIPPSSWGYDANNLQPGDLCVWSNGPGDPNGGHTLIFVSSEKGFAENGKSWKSNAQSYINSKKGAPKGFHVFRVSDSGAAKVTNLNTEFSVGGFTSTGGGIGLVKVNSSQFYFNGIPDGRYSIVERNIFTIFINALGELANFFTGLLTYLFRGLIISFISIFDRLLNNTIKSMDSGNAESLEEAGVSSTSADDPLSMNRVISIEQLIYNQIDLFDVDIFKVETEETEEVQAVEP